MPTYVYECNSCDKTFEIEQRITEDPLTDCACGSAGSLRRLIQPTAVVFRGSGFHINDYSSGGSSAKEEAKSEAAPPPSCSGEPASCPSCAPSAEA